jgi:hypothetical protein
MVRGDCYEWVTPDATIALAKGQDVEQEPE